MTAEDDKMKKKNPLSLLWDQPMTVDPHRSMEADGREPRWGEREVLVATCVDAHRAFLAELPDTPTGPVRGMFEYVADSLIAAGFRLAPAPCAPSVAETQIEAERRYPPDSPTDDGRNVSRRVAFTAGVEWAGARLREGSLR